MLFGITMLLLGLAQHATNEDAGDSLADLQQGWVCISVPNWGKKLSVLLHYFFNYSKPCIIQIRECV